MSVKRKVLRNLAKMQATIATKKGDMKTKHYKIKIKHETKVRLKEFHDG